MRLLIPRRLLAAMAAVALLVVVLPTPPASAATVTFSYTGGVQQFTVPAGVTAITVDVQGAQGEAALGAGGLGGQAIASLTVSPGDVLQLMVGGQGAGGSGGFNGGGDGGIGALAIGGGGGGASDVRIGACAATNSCGLADRAVVAGGGGGTESAGFLTPVQGGDGGLVGGDGLDPGALLIFGAGGSGAAGGAGGGTGTAGGLGQGGNGGDAVDTFNFDEAGGGGGGGYFGGGGGGGGDVNTNGDPSGGNAGGGSSFGPGGTTFGTGVNSGNGSITITYTGPPPATPTATSIISSSTPSPSVFGEPVSFTAAVVPIPTGGSVQFQVDGNDVGSPIPVDGAGEATSAPVPDMVVGARSVTAVYSGDPSFATSTSPGLAHTVDPASTTSLLASTPIVGTDGEPIDYTVLVTADGPSTATATGTVAFTDDGTPIPGCGAIPLDGGQEATCTSTAGADGVHTIVATYAGTPSLSSSLDQLMVTVDPLPPVATTTTTTAAPTTTMPATTAAPTTTVPATAAPTSAAPTSAAPTSAAPTTVAATTNATVATAAATTSTTSATTTTSRPSPSTTAEAEVALATTTTIAPIAPVAMANVVFNVAIETTIEGATADVQGEGFLPGSTAVIMMYSDPIELGAAVIAADGTFDTLVEFPAGVPAGSHRVEVSGRSAVDEPVSYTWYLELDDAALVTRIERDLLPEPPDWYVPDSLALELPYDELIPEYIVTEHAPAVVATMVSGFALLTVLGGVGGGGLAGIGGFSGSGSATNGGLSGLGAGAVGARLAGARNPDETADDAKKRKRKLGGAAAKHHLLDLDSSALGDRSLTWQFRFLGQRLDAWSAEFPPRVAATSPLLARILTDGIHGRAMFGSLSLFAPLLGIVLGVAASLDVGGAPIPPATALVIAIVVLSIYDSMAGVCAAIAYTVLTLFGGDVNSLDAVRGLLGVNLVFFAAPLIASKARPLRRDPSVGTEAHFDRLADVVIASLIGAWAAKKLVGALPGLSGLDFPIASQAGTIALVVLGALVVRFLLETIVMWWYPARLSTVSPEALPKPSDRQKLAVLVFQTGMFLFMAYPFLGNVWELWAGTALFSIPQLIGMRKDNLPNLPWLVRWLPGGIVKTTIMMVVGTYFAAMVRARIDDPARFITLGFVILSFPGLLFTVFGFFGRDGKKWELNWPFRLGGIAVLAVGVMLAEQIITLG